MHPKAFALSLLLATAGGSAFAQESPTRTAEPASIDCDRQARKVIEALQAWRRTHHGEYPATLSSLAESGLLEPMELRCPAGLDEPPQASSENTLSDSRGEHLDPPGTYNYELVPKVDDYIKPYMGEGISRREIKTELLRRPHAEQVPLLRCSAHRAARPSVTPPAGMIFRNITASGLAYWSGDFWEREWPEIPELGRQALVVRGLRGPPFHRDAAPLERGELDLRPFYNACGERAWWWGFKYLQRDPLVEAPDLSALLAPGGAQSRVLGGCHYWLDGVIQLQGRLGSADANPRSYVREVYPWKTALIPVTQPVATARVLLACIWEDRDGAEVGALVWRYADRTDRRTPFFYGQTLRRFWDKTGAAPSFPTPVFQSSDGRGVTVRLYAAACENPRPEAALAGLILESNRHSPAAPFILAITVDQKSDLP
jgi:hypothetical protein